MRVRKFMGMEKARDFGRWNGVAGLKGGGSEIFAEVGYSPSC